MRENEVDRILRKIIKGRTFWDDVTEKGVIFLDEGLLGGTHWVTVEQGDLLLAFPVVFKGEGIREFPAVVAQENIHEGGDGEPGIPQPVFQATEVGGALGSGLAIQEEASHEVAGCEVDGHDGFPADAPEHSVKLGMPFKAVASAVGQEVVIGAPEFDAGGDIIRAFFPAGLELDRAGQVNAGGGIIAFVKMAVDSAFGAGDAGRVGHDVVDMLPSFQGLRNDAVCLVEFLLVKRDALPGSRKEPPVFRMGGSCAVKEVGIVTGSAVPLRAAVADEGSL